MRISIVSTMGGVPWGGSEELWAEMSRTGVEYGHKMAAWLWRHDKIRPQVQKLEAVGVQIAQYPPPDTWYQKLRQRFVIRHPGIARRCPKFFKSFESLFRATPDVVFLSLGDTYVLGLHREFQFLVDELIARSIPYVVVVQLSVDHWTPDASAAAVTQRAFNHAHCVGFVSEHNRQLIRRQLAAPLPNAIVVRNPVNMADVAPVAFPRNEIVAMACVGRFQLAHKGQDRLIESMAVPVWRGRDWQLRLYGAGPDESKVRQLIASHQLEDKIEVCGHMHDIRALWADNQLLVMPSLMEGTPLAMVEAMLCGRPVVGTKVGGIPEWVEEGKSGFIADSPTVESLAAALERAWAARTTWESMGKVANERAMALHDPDPGLTLLKILEEAAS